MLLTRNLNADDDPTENVTVCVVLKDRYGVYPVTGRLRLLHQHLGITVTAGNGLAEHFRWADVATVSTSATQWAPGQVHSHRPA